MRYNSKSVEDTMSLARELAQRANAGDIIALSGELGAGKTAFAQGFAKGLGIQGHVVSPTFTIMQIYEGGRLPMYHFDLYRLEGAEFEEFEEVGLLEYLDDGPGVALVEWAEYAGDIIPDGAVWVEIRRSDDGGFTDGREIHIR